VAGLWLAAPVSASGGEGSKNMPPVSSNTVLMIRIPKPILFGVQIHPKSRHHFKR
jgi:hypothetical protein